MAQVAHFGAIVAPVLAPLFVYLMKKDESKFVAFQSLQALYFSIASFAAIMILAFVLVGFLLWPVAVLFHVIAGLKITNGLDFEYPLVGKIARQSVYGS